MNDYEAWLRELLAACNQLVDNWEGDIATPVNTIRLLLEESGDRDPT